MNEPQHQSDYRWLLVVQLYLSTIAWGAVQVFNQNIGPYLLFGIFMAATATQWTVLDARRRGHSIRHILLLLIVLFWSIAVPIYLIWSRGFRGLGWALLHALGLLLALCLGYYVTVFAVYGLDAFSDQL